MKTYKRVTRTLQWNWSASYHILLKAACVCAACPESWTSLLVQSASKFSLDRRIDIEQNSQ